ncbi:MAG: Ca2+-dependent phosphoinositide-specific phospholipase C [Eubacteriales bacterium]
MPTNLTKAISFIVSIILAVSQFPAIANRYVKNSMENKAAQTERLEAMKNGEISVVDEQSFASFDLNDPTIKYNKVRTIMTHNSYKRAMDNDVYKLSIRFFDEEKFKGSLSEHDTLVAQLKNGVRALEIDVRYQINGFKVFHFPLVDASSTSPDWKMTLEELNLWSNANPGHVPITVLVEMKEDIIYLNPLYRKMDETKFKALDKTIKDIMGDDKVVTASDIMGGYSTLAEVIKNDGWPKLSELRGKIIFLLHPDDKYTDMYINLDRTLKSQVFIPMIDYKDIDLYNDYAAFILHNQVDVDYIKDLVNKNYIVRTQMDSQQVYDEKLKAQALESGAQLLNTNLEKGIIFPKTGYEASLKDNYTIIDN